MPLADKIRTLFSTYPRSCLTISINFIISMQFFPLGPLLQKIVNLTTTLISNYIILVLLVALGFISVCRAIDSHPNFVPNKAKKSPQHYWKWKNFGISVIHSGITGILALSLLLFVKQFLAEPIKATESQASILLLCFTCGYFIYDSYEMLAHVTSDRSSEFILHHSFAVVSISIGFLTRRYVGLILVGVLQELSSVFLNIRQVLPFYGYNRESVPFKINSFINLVAFIPFRFLLAPYFCWLWYQHYNDASILASIVYNGISLWSWVYSWQLFIACFKADILNINPKLSKSDAVSPAPEQPQT